MNENEQINEMANDLAKICPDLVDNCCGQVNCVTHLTLSLSKLRYRKIERGEWEQYGLRNPKCTLCHGYNTEKSNFCPNCGADMRGEK